MERASAEVDTPDTRTSPARRGSAPLSGVPPRQWVKNILVFVAPGAAGVLTHPNVILRSVGTFAVFCAAASATYLVNDVLDTQADRSHPGQMPATGGRR